jgi:hypothetical protein
MAWDDLVRVKLENGSVTSVGRSFAESHSLTILTDSDGNEVPATSNGLTIEPEYPLEVVATDDGTNVMSMKGAQLNDALSAAGLSSDGTLAERQQRLADHIAAGGHVDTDQS